MSVPLKKRADGIITGADWDHLAIDFLGEGRDRYTASYVVYTNGTDTWAFNGVTGIIDYGGPNDNGGVDGADETAVIQAAIDAIGTLGRGELYIGQGQYDITTSLDLSGVYAITIRGEGRGRAINQAGGAWVDEGTILKLADGVDDHLLQMIEIAPSKLTAVTILDLNFHGNAANQTPGAASDIIHLDHVKEVIIERCQIMRGVRYGISLVGACENNWIINNCITQGGDGSHCINQTTAISTKILGNKILGASAANARGINLENASHYNDISDNTITDCDDGIRLQDSDFNRIINNLIADCDKANITIYDDSHKNTVVGNDIRNSVSFRGLMIADFGTGATLNMITNNVITGNNTYGIEILNNATNNFVYDNIFDGNGSGPINDAGTNTVILNNGGYNPQAASTPAVGASPVTFGPYAYPILVEVAGGNVTSVTVRGQVATLTAGQWMLYPTDTCVIVYVAPPTVTLWPQ